jgi:hypothetical protein
MTKNQTETTSQRKCVIDGKHFTVTRHFTGEKNLRDVLMDIAVNRAKKEMGL